LIDIVVTMGVSPLLLSMSVFPPLVLKVLCFGVIVIGNHATCTLDIDQVIHFFLCSKDLRKFCGTWRVRLYRGSEWTYIGIQRGSISANFYLSWRANRIRCWMVSYHYFMWTHFNHFSIWYECLILVWMFDITM